MPASPHWARWVRASVVQYLHGIAALHSLPVVVEGVDDRTEEFMQSTDRVEVRFTGPWTKELSHNYFRLEASANVLITSRLDVEQKNRFTIDTNAGFFHEAMDRRIPVYKFGSKPGDDQSYLGCLTPSPQRGESVRVFHFGQLGDDRLTQAAVDARYEMELTVP